MEVGFIDDEKQRLTKRRVLERFGTLLVVRPLWLMLVCNLACREYKEQCSIAHHNEGTALTSSINH